MSASTKRKVRVRVNASDIKCGERRSSNSCPVAFALIRAFKPHTVGVGSEILRVNDEIFQIPDAARAFIKRFDRGFKVKPFSFTLYANSKGD